MKRERELEVDEAQTLKTAASLGFIFCEWTNVALELTRPWVGLLGLGQIWAI